MTEADAIERARDLLGPPQVRDPALGALGAALLAAVSALLMAGAVIVGPGFEVDAPAPGAMNGFD
ncbi:MAG: peptidoglycan-binding protein [Brevundimonas sp.]